MGLDRITLLNLDVIYSCTSKTSWLKPSLDLSAVVDVPVSHSILCIKIKN